MTKVHGKRYVIHDVFDKFMILIFFLDFIHRYAYKFDFHGLMAACQSQAQGCDTSANMIANYSKYHHPPIALNPNELSNYASASGLTNHSPGTSTNNSGSFKPVQSPVSSIISSTSTPSPTQSTNSTLAPGSDRNNFIYWPYPPVHFDPRSPSNF